MTIKGESSVMSYEISSRFIDFGHIVRINCRRNYNGRRLYNVLLFKGL